MASTAYRKMAGEVVAKDAGYLGNDYNKPYYINFEGKAYTSKDTADLADQIAAAMRSSAARLREHLKRRVKDM